MNETGGCPVSCREVLISLYTSHTLDDWQGTGGATLTPIAGGSPLSVPGEVMETVWRRGFIERTRPHSWGQRWPWQISNEGCREIGRPTRKEMSTLEVVREPAPAVNGVLEGL